MNFLFITVLCISRSAMDVEIENRGRIRGRVRPSHKVDPFLNNISYLELKDFEDERFLEENEVGEDLVGHLRVQDPQRLQILPLFHGLDLGTQRVKQKYI